MPGDSSQAPDASTQWQAISEIVDGALELHGEERVAYIDERCGGDPELRKEVDQFLAACDLVSRSPTFLRGRPHLFLNDLAADVDAREAAAHATLKARVQSALADKYSIAEVLGSGGAATVFRAVDRFTQGTVALKVLHPELSHSLGSDRFLREVRIVASLRHPNIIPLLSAGVADGLPYYVMPCIDGQTLRARLMREPQLPTSLVLSITRDVAAALDAAHAQGILHRDIKPQNILLDGERALVADFGIARAIETAGGDALTQSGTVVGTPGYMSPEQVSGDTRIDLRSDVYALACVSYEMLAGEPPFTGAQSRALLAKQLWAPVPDVRVLRTSLPAEVTAVLQRGLAKHAADRYENAGAFSSALASAVASQAIDRRRARMSEIAAAAALLIAVCALGGWAAVRHSRAVEAAALANADTTKVVVFPIDTSVSHLLTADAAHAAISRWNGVSVLGPQALHDELGGADARTLSSTKAREIALNFHAARFIRTAVQQSGIRARVQAELFDVHDRAVPLWQESRETSARRDSVQGALASVIDGLLLRTRDSTALREGTQQTRSLAARQSFLRGMAAMTDWNLAAADSSFASAFRSDAAYARAGLWLALARIWESRDSSTWVYAAEAAAAKRGQLSADEQAMATAVAALAHGDRPTACNTWASLADANQYEFTAWYGAAQCMANDDIVLPDASSLTGWRFRTGSHSTLLRYQRAFALRPAVLGSLRDDQFRRLRRLLWTSGIDLRTGRRPGEVARTFNAYPSLANDTLAFYPLPMANLASANRSSLARLPGTVGEAVARQRALFADITKEWASSDPASGPALEAVALSLCLLGDRAAIDTLHRARRLAHSGRERLNVMATETWVRFQFAVPGDVGGIRAAAALADTVLHDASVTAMDPLALASVAAMVGRIRLADSLEQNPEIPSGDGESPALSRLERRLSLYAASGGPIDSLRSLEARAHALLSSVIPEARREGATDRTFTRAATLAWPDFTLAALSTMPDSGYYLVRAVKASLRGDSSGVRRILAEIARVRGEASYESSLDGLLVEASLLHRVGDTRGAYDWLTPGLARLKTSVPFMDAVRAAAMMRAMVLEADLAHELGDDVAASEWASSVVLMWHSEDPFLASTRKRMQSYQLARR